MKKAKQKLSDALATFVRGKYEIAKNHKQEQGVFETLTNCVSAVRGEPIVELDESLPKGVTANIISPIIRGVIGMLRDIYGQNTSSPFVLEPTPMVDLPKAVQDELRQAIMQNQDSILQAANYDTNAVESQLKELRSLTLKEEQERAAKAAELLTIAVSDKLLDAGWHMAFEHDAIQHFVMFPTVIMKCPVYKTQRVKVWTGNNYSSEMDTVMTVEAISPFNFYPSPDATNAQDAEYVIEKRRITNAELMTLTAADGFDEDGLDALVEKYPNGYIEPYENAADNLTQIDSASGDADKNPTQCYDTLGYFGRVSGKVLMEYGVEGANPARMYEAEVWIVDKIVIKATLNPDTLGRRPFYTTSFEPIPNSFWGECPNTRMFEHQRACTSAIAHMFRNVSFSSGPVIERDESRLVNDDDDSGDLSPYKIIDVKPNHVNNAPVHRFIETPSRINELVALYDKFKGEAYDAIGIPKALFGGVDGMGTIGRTSGGIATVYAQGSKAIKYSMRLLEECVIEPVIQRIVDNVLLETTDERMKGDVRVRARGVSGIVERDNKREQLNWAIQSLGPLMQLQGPDGQPYIPPEAPVRLLYEQFKAMGIPTEGIFAKDYDAIAAVKQDVGTSPEVVAQPMLDGRSPDAMAAISDMGGAGMSGGADLPGSM